MPIKVSRIEPRIYRVDYIGRVQQQDILAAKLPQLAAEHGEDDCIMIIDATQMESFPFDIIHLTQARENEYKILRGVVIVAAPELMKRLTDVLEPIVTLPIRHVDLYAKALIEARAMLQT
jgi:hypothetical protein